MPLPLYPLDDPRYLTVSPDDMIAWHLESGYGIDYVERLELSDVVPTLAGVLRASYAIENAAHGLLPHPTAPTDEVHELDWATWSSVADDLDEAARSIGPLGIEPSPAGPLGGIAPAAAPQAIANSAEKLRAAVAGVLLGGDAALESVASIPDIAHELRRAYWAARGRTYRCQAEHTHAIDLFGSWDTYVNLFTKETNDDHR